MATAFDLVELMELLLIFQQQQQKNEPDISCSRNFFIFFVLASDAIIYISSECVCFGINKPLQHKLRLV